MSDRRILAEAYRIRGCEHGSSWTWFIRLRSFFVEVNFGRDVPPTEES